ncbi:VOC family protein [Yinghuangia seranimata]|uniref:VOC family protein n=1 Tax=Yinghuangia seranimata TaxID=408067 RepID=UPI00248AD79F|nr:VOC family protein [Yinghuangia seranimata]MDI2125984.1 VOC family protein [Yinghuangia seranimata]
MTDTTPARPRVRGYSHIGVGATDLDAARAFYTGLLGFEELPRPDDIGPGMWLRVGDLQLHFVQTDDMPTPGGGLPHIALHVDPADYDPLIAELRAADVPFLIDPFHNGENWAAFVSDPSGNFVELTTLGPLPARD